MTQHRINADVVMELIKELLKAIAEYSQLNRDEFIETVRKAQTSQQSSEITRLKSRLSEEIAEMEAELSGYEEEKQWLKKQNFKNTAEDAYTG